MTETGLLFGSFNPIHIGHLAVANYMLEYVPFNELWFVVSPQNPFKEEENLAPASHRLKMSQIAIQKDLRFKVSDIEFNLPKPSYTIHSLRKISETFPNHRFSLIIGSDNLQTLNRWYAAEEILHAFPIFVYPRPGYPLKGVSDDILSAVNLIEAPSLNISSTLIREGIKKGKKLPYLVPHGVFDYISENKLYQMPVDR